MSPSPGLNEKESSGGTWAAAAAPARSRVQRGRLEGIKAQSEEPTTEGRDQHWPRWGISPLG